MLSLSSPMKLIEDAAYDCRYGSTLNYSGSLTTLLQLGGYNA